MQSHQMCIKKLNKNQKWTKQNFRFYRAACNADAV